jgi:hypothetical protein
MATHDRIILRENKGVKVVSEDDVNTIIELIDKRFNNVLEANNIEASEDNFQYVWIKGIYSDIKEYLKVSLKQ